MKNNPMTCEKFVASLQAFRDDELTSPDRIRAQQHLAACATCSAYVRGYERTIELAKSSASGSDDVTALPESLLRKIVAARSEGHIMKATAAPIPFAGSVLTEYRHVCAFFSSPQEEYATILPFVLDGLQRGERAYHVLRSPYREKHLEELRNAGIDVASAQQRHQLEVTTAEETYLRGGTFNEDAMLDLIQETLKSGASLGFPLTRLVVHVAEAVMREDWSNEDQWIKYESRLNEVLPDYDDPVICTYDTNLITGAIAVDVLRTHPVAIVGGLLYQNPFYVPPREFLSRFRPRGAAPRNG